MADAASTQAQPSARVRLARQANPTGGRPFREYLSVTVTATPAGIDGSTPMGDGMHLTRMDSELPFRLLTTGGMAANFLIRRHFQQRAALLPKVAVADPKADVAPTYASAATLLYAVTPFADRASLPSPRAVRWFGVLPGVGGLALFIAAHRALDKYWVAELALAQDHPLLTSGPYSRVRHPMYASFFLSALGTLLISANWLVSFPLIGVLIRFYLNRVDAEESMMTERFGDEYRTYVQRTGRLLPVRRRAAT